MYYFLFSCCTLWEDLFPSPRILEKKKSHKKKKEEKYPRSQKKSTLLKMGTVQGAMPSMIANEKSSREKKKKKIKNTRQ